VALARIVNKVEDGAADGRSTVPFWESVEMDMEAEQVRPDTKAGAQRAHYSALVAGLKKHLPAGQFETLAGKLKTKGSRLGTAAPSPAGESIDAPEQSPERELLRQKIAQKMAVSDGL
jgi:hypothetical protein